MIRIHSQVRYNNFVNDRRFSKEDDAYFKNKVITNEIIITDP